MEVVFCQVNRRVEIFRKNMKVECDWVWWGGLLHGGAVSAKPPKCVRQGRSAFAELRCGFCC